MTENTRRPHPGPFARSNDPAIKTWPLPTSPKTTDPQPIGPIPAWVREHWKGDKPYPKPSSSDKGVQRSRVTTDRIIAETGVRELLGSLARSHTIESPSIWRAGLSNRNPTD